MAKRHASLRYALLAGTALTAQPLAAGELPTGASVVHGAVGIATPEPGKMAIHQSSQSAIVAWQGFSIGSESSVDIRQPSASSAILNRVTGATPSTIAGRLTANGQVYLVNPNGIAITRGGSVEAGAFVASTLDIADEDFLAGRLEFRGDGSAAGVTSQGTVEIGRGGYAALLGGHVENAGTVSVPLGRIGLGAGEMVTLDVSGDGFLSVAVPSQGPAADALIESSGRLSADGGRIEISAATARHTARHAVNLSGVVEARTITGRPGEIVLSGGAGGTVTVSGRLDATAAEPDSAALAASPLPPAGTTTGGAIDITGAEIRLAGAALDASGRDGGGAIRVGGDQKGGGVLPRARSTAVDAATQISADALDAGDGGRVVVWSDALTTFEGGISARGGPAGGNGGFAEVSGESRLEFTGRTDLSAPAGAFGTLLLDPHNVLISGDPGDLGAPFEAGVDDSVINATVLSNALESGNVTVSTGTDGSQEGNITVAAPLSWGAATTLTLESQDFSPVEFGAVNSVFIDAPIVAANGGLTISVVGEISASEAVSVETFRLLDGSWLQSGPDLPGFQATDFAVSEFASFMRAEGGDGMPGSPFLIADVYGLQGIDSSGFSDASFALVQDIEASATAAWSSGAGFDPIGEPDLDSTPFTGNFDGAGNTITGLSIARPGSPDPVGLFGLVGDGASIIDLGLVGVSIAGGDNTGALAGSLSTASLVENVFATGSVSGGDNVGGLVGQHFAPDMNSFTISSAFANVDVSGGDNVGGLVGLNSGTIELAYARGSVTGANNVGGLVGSNDGGTLIQTYAVGTVTGGANTGGLVGFGGDGAVSSSFWDVAETGQAASGGGVALTTAEFQDTDGFVALAEPLGWNFDTTWAPPSPGFYPALYALEPVVRIDADDLATVYGFPDGFEPTGTLFGGPGTFIFGPADETLDTTGALTSPAFPAGDVGEYPITAATDTLSTDSVDYRLVVTEGTLTLDPATLTIVPNDVVKTYGDLYVFSDADFTVEGLANADAITVTLSSPGAAADAPVAGNDYLIEVSDLAILGADASDNIENYVFGGDGEGFPTGLLTVEPRPLTIAASDLLKLFGTELQFTGTEFSTQGLAAGDSVTSVSLTSEGVAADAPIGSYTIFIGEPEGVGLFVDEVANYEISLVPGELNILPEAEANEETAARFVPEFELPNPFDTIAYGGSGGGGPIVALPEGRADSPAAAEATLGILEELGRDLETAVEACRRSRPEVESYLDCLGSALDEYAGQIDSIALDLPEPLRGVSATIQQASREIAEARETAARQLATAQTPVERTRIRREAAAKARAAVATATAEIRKQIALIRADEPQVARLQVEQGDAITAALDIVGADLERVVGL